MTGVVKTSDLTDITFTKNGIQVEGSVGLHSGGDTERGQDSDN
jgi:hypothetical protein